MADMIAIGYDDEETAAKAAEEVYRLSHDLLIEPEAVAVIVRDQDGKYKVTTNHHPVAEGAAWGLLWGAVFGLLFFVPFIPVVGGALGALFGAIEKAGIDESFQNEVRDMLQPGTSALFVIADKVTPDKVTEALSKYGGRVLKTSLTRDAEQQLQDALRGQGSAQASEAAASSAA